MAHQTLFQRFSDTIVEYVFLRFIPVSVTPNWVTAIRLALTPIVVLLLVRDFFIWATLVFCVAALTDLIDGAMARTRDQITDLGKILDPVADKLLIGSLMIPLVATVLHPLFALLIVILELSILVGGYLHARRGYILQANWWGKIKFNFQVIGILLLLINAASPYPMLVQGALMSFSAALGFGVLSLLTHGF